MPLVLPWLSFLWLVFFAGITLFLTSAYKRKHLETTEASFFKPDTLPVAQRTVFKHCLLGDRKGFWPVTVEGSHLIFRLLVFSGKAYRCVVCGLHVFLVRTCMWTPHLCAYVWTAIFLVILDYPVPPRFSSFTCFGREPLRTSGTSCLWVDVLAVTWPSASRHSQSTEPSQWHGLILSSSTTRLLTERALLPLPQLTDMPVLHSAARIVDEKWNV